MAPPVHQGLPTQVMKIAKRYLQKGETIYETKTYAGGGHQVLLVRGREDGTKGWRDGESKTFLGDFDLLDCVGV